MGLPAGTVRRALAVAYGVFWTGGLAAYAAGATPPGAAWAAPAFLLLAASTALLGAPTAESRRLLGIGAVGLLAEGVGVHTGLPFGAYVYTPALGPRLLGVPAAMAAAWLVLFGYVRQGVAASGLRAPAARWAATAAWMTALDLVVDPLAAGPLGYWQWAGTGPYYGIPWSNFAGWFLVSGLLAALFPAPAPRAPAVRATGASVLAFFAGIAALRGLRVAAAAGVLLLALDLGAARRASTSCGRTPPR